MYEFSSAAGASAFRRTGRAAEAGDLRSPTGQLVGVLVGIVVLAFGFGLDKYTDLKDRFYAERQAREAMTDREAKLHTEIAQLNVHIDELREERNNYRTANEVFARALHALTVENDSLRRSTSRSHPAHLSVIDPGRHRPAD